jgi:demethylmenaquinone methyltransferase/2-methoxy-6-polyprenyl-1,4-benzoquinol methylase
MHPAENDGVDEAHLERSRRVWDRWSDHYDRSEADFAPMREKAIDYLSLQSGDTVLDVGCGPGVNFESLRDAVGPDGYVLALDYSPAMVERARARVEDRGWTNVEVREADATTTDLESGRFDAAIATLSMSVLPDVERAARNVRRALAPGARFVVFDLRQIPEGPLRVLNPLLVRFFRWYANWNADDDVLAALADVFGDVEVVETYFAGANYTAVVEAASADTIRASVD